MPLSAALTVVALFISFVLAFVAACLATTSATSTDPWYASSAGTISTLGLYHLTTYTCGYQQRFYPEFSFCRTVTDPNHLPSTPFTTLPGSAATVEASGRLFACFIATGVACASVCAMLLVTAVVFSCGGCKGNRFRAGSVCTALSTALFAVNAALMRSSLDGFRDAIRAWASGDTVPLQGRVSIVEYSRFPDASQYSLSRTASMLVATCAALHGVVFIIAGVKGWRTLAFERCCRPSMSQQRGCLKWRPGNLLSVRRRAGCGRRWHCQKQWGGRLACAVAPRYRLVAG